MRYSISISKTRKYVLVMVNGNINRELALKYTVESHIVGNENKIEKILLDLRNAKNIETVTDNFEFANKDLRSATVINKSAKIAMYVSENDHSHDFVETVSRNNGHNVKICRTEEEVLDFFDLNTL